MSLKNVRPGPFSVAEYQMSGVPFVTGSSTDEVVHNAATRVQFPYVTSEIIVQCSGSDPLYVGFSEHGVRGDIASGETHRFQLEKPELSTMGPSNALSRLELKVRCTELWFMAASPNGGAVTTGFQLVASLTNIPSKNMFTLTGSLNDPQFKGIG